MKKIMLYIIAVMCAFIFFSCKGKGQTSLQSEGISITNEINQGETEKVKIVNSTEGIKKDIVTLENNEAVKKARILELMFITKDFHYYEIPRYESIEVLLIRDSQLGDLAWLKSMKSVRYLIFQGVVGIDDNTVLDLSNCPKLEYIEISNQGLTKLPLIISPRKSEISLNLIYNKINNLTVDQRFELAKYKRYYLLGNPVDKETKGIFDVLPKEYQPYIH